MTCQGYPVENYGLFALGELEEEEAAKIRKHLEAECTTCLREVRAYSEVWYLTASALAAEKPSEPPSRLRSKVLRAAKSTPIAIRKREASLAWRWIPAAAAAVLIFGLAWTAGRYSADRQMSKSLELQAHQLQQTEESERNWQQRAAQAERLLAEKPPTPVAIAPVPAPAPVAGDSPATLAALTKARADVKALEDSLARERSQQTTLSAELSSQKGLLASAIQQKNELERRVQGSADEAQKRSELETRVAGLTARVQQLTRENTRYQEAVESLTRQADRNSRLVAFFSSDSVKSVKLRPTEAGGKSTAQAFIADGQRVVFYASGLPALAPGRTYQLWLMRAKGPGIVSAGIFRPQGNGRASIEFTDRTLISDVTGVAVSEEPDGGSAQPTGHKLLVGTNKS
jgi:anti-sigma-K factor RskA